MKRKIATKDLVLTALFAALTAVLAQIQLPIGPVPFNLAVFGAFLAGMLLEPAWAAASMGVYMLLGVVGIPVFAGFMGGPCGAFGQDGRLCDRIYFHCSGHSAGRQTFGQAACDRGRQCWRGCSSVTGSALRGSWPSPGRILFRRWAGACCRSLCRTCAKGVLACVLGRLLAGRLAKAGVA